VIPDIYNVFTVPHIQASIFSWTCLRCNWRYHDHSMCVILQTWCQIHRTPSGLRYMNCVPGHIQCISSSIYSDFNIQLNVSTQLFEIIGHYNARYTANLVPNTAQILQFTQCVLWPLTYTKYLQLLIVRPLYSTEPDCAATRDMPPFSCALYCNIGAIYSAHPPVYAVWTVVRTYRM
jgi:hypothetical protein